MQVHASCAARDGAGVLLIGPPGSGKSDLVIRLMDRGFELVADDRVELDGGVASAPLALAGLIEVRGLGIVRMPFLVSTRLALVVALVASERMPEPSFHLDLPLVRIDPAQPSAAARIALALRCVSGEVELLAGALA